MVTNRSQDAIKDDCYCFCTASSASCFAHSTLILLASRVPLPLVFVLLGFRRPSAAKNLAGSSGDDQSAIVDIMIWIYLFVCCSINQDGMGKLKPNHNKSNHW